MKIQLEFETFEELIEFCKKVIPQSFPNKRGLDIGDEADALETVRMLVDRKKLRAIAGHPMARALGSPELEHVKTVGDLRKELRYPEKNLRYCRGMGPVAIANLRRAFLGAED